MNSDDPGNTSSRPDPSAHPSSHQSQPDTLFSAQSMGPSQGGGAAGASGLPGSSPLPPPPSDMLAGGNLDHPSDLFGAPLSRDSPAPLYQPSSKRFALGSGSRPFPITGSGFSGPAGLAGPAGPAPRPGQSQSTPSGGSTSEPPVHAHPLAHPHAHPLAHPHAHPLAHPHADARAHPHAHADAHAPVSASAPGDEIEAAGSEEARRAAHRGYTQKSREKVNVRFDLLLEILPQFSPSRAIPRSKADILEYATQQIKDYQSSVKALNMKVALSSVEELQFWLARQTTDACRLREVAGPVIDLFCIGMGWPGAEVWSIAGPARSEIPYANENRQGYQPTQVFTQAWTHTPPSQALVYKGPSSTKNRQPLSLSEMAVKKKEEEDRDIKMNAFLSTGADIRIPVAGNSFLSMAFNTARPIFLRDAVRNAASDPTNPALARFTMPQNGMSAGSTAKISTVMIFPLRMYSLVQMLVVLYGTSREHELDSPSPSEHVKAADRIGEVLQTRYSIPAGNDP